MGDMSEKMYEILSEQFIKEREEMVKDIENVHGPLSEREQRIAFLAYALGGLNALDDNTEEEKED